MRCSYRICAHLLHHHKLTSECCGVHRRTERTEIVMHTNAFELLIFSVARKSFVRIECERPESESIYNTVRLFARMTVYLSLQFINIRRVCTPKTWIFNAEHLWCSCVSIIIVHLDSVSIGVDYGMADSRYHVFLAGKFAGYSDLSVHVSGYVNAVRCKADSRTLDKPYIPVNSRSRIPSRVGHTMTNTHCNSVLTAFQVRCYISFKR